MRVSRLSRIALAVALVVFALAASAGGAAAGPKPTPNGWIGACNMVVSWPGVRVGPGVGVKPGGGMERAMTVDNPNGNEGMFNAVAVSGGQIC